MVSQVSAMTGSENYGEWLSKQLDQRGYTTRAFSKLWNPTDPETARRQLRRYLKGQVPHERTRKEIASVLGSKEIGPDTAEED